MKTLISRDTDIKAVREAGFTVHKGEDCETYAYCIDGCYSKEFDSADDAWDGALQDHCNTLKILSGSKNKISNLVKNKFSEWSPIFSKWRHGGWYVNNVRYPSGAIGCVSNKYIDKKWRIVCDDRLVEIDGEGDFTYKSRDAAARAEREIASLKIGK
jgi:hypothetical protein